MAKLENHIVDTWFIAKNENNTVIHYGLCEVGQVTETGQPILETYENESDWLNRLGELEIFINIE